MLKKFLLIVLLMALIAPWTANAQTCEAPTDFYYYDVDGPGPYYFTWNGGSGVYNLKYSASGNDDDWTMLLTNYPYNSYECDFGPGYIWLVQSVCDNSVSEWVLGYGETTPTCETPTGFYAYLNYEQAGMTMWGEVGWNGVQGAESYDLEVNGVIENISANTSSNNFYDQTFDIEASTTYTVRVRTVCSSGAVSDWTEPQVFTTPECLPLDRCDLYIYLTDDYGNGWDEGIIQVLDVATGDILSSLPACEGASSNAPVSGSMYFYVCDGNEIQIVWNGPIDNMEQYTIRFGVESGLMGYDIVTGDPSILPYNYSCGTPMVTQNMTIPSGSSWQSFEVDITLEELQENLVEAMNDAGATITPDNTISIRNRDLSCYYTGSRWRGQLTTLDPTQMYMIHLPADGLISLRGVHITPTETITISNGANWIVFPLDQPMSVGDAFAGFAVSGDVIRTKDVSATYTGTRWRGNLTTLQPGECYIYTSSVAGDRPFTFPTPSK